jgi:hypothetical protein
MKFDLLTIKRLALASGILCSLIPNLATASSLVFNFDAAYTGTTNFGNTSSLPDLSIGLVRGQIIHGSFSYDPSTEPFMTEESIFGNGTLGRFNTGAFLFSIPSLSFSTDSSNAWVFDATVAGSGESFGVFANVPASAALPPNTVIDVGFISSAGNVFSSLALPVSILLNDFDIAVLAVNEEVLGGQRVIAFDITNVSATSDTPLLAALPLFVSGGGLIVVLARRKNRKALAA